MTALVEPPLAPPREAPAGSPTPASSGARVVVLPAPGLGADVLGGKGANLSRLLEHGFAVPPAFVLAAPLDGADLDGALLDDVRAALATIGAGPYAVRSSATSEDGADASFAGMHETFLDVVTEEAVLEAIRACWQSGSNERSAAYRAARGIARARMAVVVQRMIRPRAAGVLFTCDPVRRTRSRILVEAVPGLGEALVSGHADPDRFVVDRASLAVLERHAADDRSAPCLDDATALLLVESALLVERAFGGGAQDLEWAVDDDGPWLLQARPVTTPLDDDVAIDPARARIVWTNTNAAEILPDVATPMTWSVAKRYVAGILVPLMRPFGTDADALGVLGLVGGRVYFNLNTVVGWMRGFPGLGRVDGRFFSKLLGGNDAALADAAAGLRADDLPTRSIPWWRVVIGTMGFAIAAVRAHSGRADGVLRALRQDTTARGAIDIAALDDAALLAHIEGLSLDPFGTRDDAVSGSAAIMAAAIGMVAAGALPKLTRRWVRDDDGAIAGRLLSGMGGLESAEAGKALWRLARVAADHGTDGEAYRAALAGFMDEHGHHARGELDVAVPRWRERPDYIAGLVRGFAAGTAAQGGAALHDERSATRDAFLDEVAGRTGPLRRAVLRAVVARARNGAAARENGKNQAMRRLAILRASLLETGRRLVARGIFATTDDVFFLLLDELGPALRATAGAAWAPRIGTRRAEHARNCALSPPPVVVGDYDPAKHLPLRSTFDPGATVLRGIAASPGIAEGRAKVVLRTDDGATVDAGEILVAPFTDPGWTPYFLAASAVVMDFGGMLSHGSVVAREYGLPAVVNCAGATSLIRTGQRIRVDGTRGEVLLLDDPKSP